MNSRQDDWAGKIAEAHQNKQPKPLIDEDVSVDDAYGIQTEVVQRLGGSIVGFKGALSSPVGQAAFGLEEPVFGVLTDQSEVSSGFALSDMANPMIEIELGFQLGVSLSGPLSPVDFNQVFMSTIIAIDIAEAAFAGHPKGTDFVTSNAAAGRFMRGPVIQYNDPNTVPAQLSLNGEVINTATSGDIGDQRELAVWLINRALRLGYEVQSGLLVMTGAMGQVLPAKPGDYEAKYGDFGSFAFSLAG